MSNEEELQNRHLRLFELANIRVCSTAFQTIEPSRHDPLNSYFNYTDVDILSTLSVEFEIRQTGELIEINTSDEYELLFNLASDLPNHFGAGDLIAWLHQKNKENEC